MTADKRSASTYINSVWSDGSSGESYVSMSPSTEQMRADALNKYADILEREMEPMARLIASEVGTPIGVLRWYAEMAVKGRRGGYEQALPHYNVPVPSGSLLHYEPVGVIASLPANNYPLNLLIWKLGGAIASGCTTVVLPSPQGMVSTLRIFELLDEVGLPPGVVNLVVGGPEIGIHLTGHPDVDMVSFTGSDAVGAKVMAQGALGSVSKAVLELGGKSPNIILPSADLPATVGASTLRYARNAGQGCAAWSRILVPEDKVEELCRLVDEFIAGVKGGDPFTNSLSSPKMIRDIANQFPGLRLMACHFGGYKILDDAEEMLSGADVVLETSWPPSLASLRPERVRDLIRHHGAERVVFGSDWPMTSPAEEIRAIQALGLTDDETKMVLGGTLAGLLGLEV